MFAVYASLESAFHPTLFPGSHRDRTLWLMRPGRALPSMTRTAAEYSDENIFINTKIHLATELATAKARQALDDWRIHFRAADQP